MTSLVISLTKAIFFEIFEEKLDENLTKNLFLNNHFSVQLGHVAEVLDQLLVAK